METIVFFTNWQSVKRIKGNHKLSWEPSDTDDEAAKKVVAKNIDADENRKFVVAFDGVEVEHLDKIVHLVKEGSVYIIYHTHPDIELLDEFAEKLKKNGINIICRLKKMHQAGALYDYIPKIDIHHQEKKEIEKDTEKLKQIIEELRKIFDEIKTHFTTENKTNDLIQQWKDLSLLAIKIKNENFLETNYTDAIKLIGSNLEGFTIFSDFEKDLKNFWNSNYNNFFNVGKEANAHKTE